MKKYVKIFQQVEPAIFRIDTKQVDVFTEFLTNFGKPEVLSERNTTRKLKTIDFSSTESYLPNNLLSVGSIARKIVKNSRKDDGIMCEFLNKAITNTISLSRHEQVCLMRLCFERYFSHHRAT